jgi:hypothetical protein
MPTLLTTNTIDDVANNPSRFKGRADRGVGGAVIPAEEGKVRVYLGEDGGEVGVPIMDGCDEHKLG